MKIRYVLILTVGRLASDYLYKWIHPIPELDERMRIYARAYHIYMFICY
jgi:cytochrome b561